MPIVMALEPVTRELQQMEETMIRCVRQRTPEQLATGFYARGACVQTPGQGPVEGLPAIVKFWHSLFRAGLIEMRLESQRVGAEHDLAYGAGTFMATFETQPGILRSDHGKYLTIYRRQPDGSWRALEQSVSFDGADTLFSVP